MKLFLIVVLAVSLSGCATMRRHPALAGIIAGSAIGVSVALATRPGQCAKFYDGKPYNGTPPCPK